MIRRSLTGFASDGTKITLTEADLISREEPIVILGDAGIGKTTLLQKLSKQDGLDYLHARRLIHSRDSTHILSPGKTAVIDGLDEVSSQSEGTAVDQVLAALEQGGFPKFVLACRIADWKSATSVQAISDMYHSAPLELFLEPISKKESLAILADEVGEDRANQIIRHFEANSLEDLFGNPQTLKLIHSVSGRSKLPTTRADLFEMATKQMWSEHSQQKATSGLSHLSQDQALDAAGCAFAALILSGKTALSRLPDSQVAEEDIPLRELRSLSDSENTEAVLESRLFSASISGSTDRFTYSHRSIGEFLAARWLTRSCKTDRIRRRLIHLFHSHKLVPSNLRGVHAWLARDPKLAEAVIAADPMGLVEYGEAGQLSVRDAQTLLRALKKMGRRNPRRFDFDRAPVARGLAHPDLEHDIKSLVTDDGTPFFLKALLLNSIKGTNSAKSLSATLRKVMLDPGVTYYERHLAKESLIELESKQIDWKSALEDLHDSSDENSLRLAIDIVSGEMVDCVSDAEVAKLVLAQVGITLCEYPKTEESSLLGVLWTLARTYPASRIQPLLNILTTFLEEMLPDVGNRYEHSELVGFVHSLIQRHLTLDASIDPIELWRWISALGQNRTFNSQAKTELSDWLKSNDKVRRSIQRHALLDQDGEESVWTRGYHLNEIPGLQTGEEDLVFLLESIKDPGATSIDVWRDLVRLCHHNEQAGKNVRTAAQRFASNSDDESFISALGNPKTPSWQERDAELRRQTDAKREADWSKHRSDYEKNRASLEAGEYSQVLQPAKAYLGQFSDIPKELEGHKRLAYWLSDDLQASALQGFEAYLVDQESKPSAEEVAEAYAQRQHWPAGYVFCAALAERIRNEVGLEDLSDDRLLAVLLEIRFYSSLEFAGISGVAERIEAQIQSRPGLWTAYWKLRIESQLDAGLQHIDGLYELRNDLPDLREIVPLASHWIEQFPNMNAAAEADIADFLIGAGETESLKKVWELRRNQKDRDPVSVANWDAIGLVVDFSTFEARFGHVRNNDSEFIWVVRDRTLGRRLEDRAYQLEPEQLTWIINGYRTKWPYTYTASGSSRGDRNPSDATEFLVSLINRLAKFTSAEGQDELAKLRSAQIDSYTETLKRAYAEQEQRIVEENYSSPSLEDISSVLRDGQPTTLAQLKAVMLEELRLVQAKVYGHPLDWHRDFFEQKTPKDEEACRDLVLKMFGDFPSGIQCEPEGHLANDKRADIVCTIEELMLPIEVKGQWHDELWHAADTQLDRLYSSDWRAEREGIYLVLWFGSDVPANKKIKSQGRKHTPPKTAEELRNRLTNESQAASEGRIEIFVLDVENSGAN